MNSLPLFAIIDVETSGGKPHQSRITEVAIYITDGKNIIEEYSTLINPQTKIDYYVVQLTGITDKMVEQAPTFEQVCHDIEAILKDKIFVAHNVEFDFGMIKKEMYRSGKSLLNPKLCTVKLAKKYFPTSASYSLGNICEHLSIPHTSKHRAGGDALATVELFHKIYDQFEDHTLHIELLNGLDIDKLPENISIDTINLLPELNGLIYLKDAAGEIIYVMACKNMYTSFIKLLKQSEIAPNKRKLIESIAEVDFEVSTNYLQTLLQKYYLVKELKPRFNKRTNIKSYTHEVFLNYDEQGFAFLDNQKLDESNTAPKVKTTSKKGSEKLIANIIKYQKLEQVIEQLPEYKERFDPEMVPAYNAHFNQVFKNFHFQKPNFIIFMEQENPSNVDVFVIKDNEFKGFGTVDVSYLRNNQLEEIVDMVKPMDSNPDIIKIIKDYLYKSKENIKYF